jgi:putative copper export protein
MSAVAKLERAAAATRTDDEQKLQNKVQNGQSVLGGKTQIVECYPARPLRGWPSRWEGAAAVLLSGAFMSSLAWAGHGGASAGQAGVFQVVADALHLAAAGAWIGGLLPFALVMACALRTRSEAWNWVAVDVTRRFSAFAAIVVGVLLLTGLSNTWFLVGSLARLVGTTYGQLLLLKIALVIAMVAAIVSCCAFISD